MLPTFTLSHSSGATATIYLQGAHVASWRTAGGDEVLFMGRESVLEPGIPIRGGIPLVFPQFSDRGSLPKHGFARTSDWTLVEQGTDPSGAAFARLRLTDSEESRSLWPHRFEADFLVTLSDELLTTLRVRNTDAEPFRFTCALHGYFRVGDIGRVAVEGLEGARYLGVVPGAEPREVTDAELRIEGETDGVYASVGDRLRLRDEAAGRTLELRKEGFADAIVWNPWVERSREIADLGDEEFRDFICVEPANVATPVSLGPGEEWMGSQRLRLSSAR